MTKIVVATDNLRAGSSEFSATGSDLGKLTAQLGSSANNLGSLYNGQLASQVNVIVSQAQKNGTDLHSRLSDLSDYLSRKAASFEAVDNENEGAVLGISAQMQNYGITSLFPFTSWLNGLQMISHGTANTIWALGGFGDFRDWLTVFSPTSWYTQFQGKNHQVSQTPVLPLVTTSVPIVTPNFTFGDLINRQRQNRGLTLVEQYDGKNYAIQTYNTKDSYSAHPVDAPVMSSEGDRDHNIYNAVLNQFGVETNPRYSPRNNNTYCNIFIWDATCAMGTEIPHWVDPKTGVPIDVGKGVELNANGVVDWLNNHGIDYGWHVVTAEEAQAYANKGSPSVTVWPNPQGIGHVAMVRPGEYSATEGPVIAQAGAKNFNNTRVSETFNEGWQKKQILYYAHD